MILEKPTLSQSMLIGSLWNFVAGVAGPTVIAYTSGVVQSRSPISGVAVALLVLVGMATLFLFMVHEVLLLIPLTLLQRRKFATMTPGDLTATFVSWVLLLDLFLCFLAFLFWPGQDKTFLLGLLVLVGAAVYGTVLYARSIAAAVELAPQEPMQSVPPAPPDSPSGDGQVMSAPRKKEPTVLGLRIYVAIAVAAPLMFAFWPPGWGMTFLIACISFGAGRIVEVFVIRYRQKTIE